jgi:inner membrane protein
MNRTLFIKLGTIGLLMLLLLIPISMIEGTISERQEHRDQVLADIAQSSSTSQQITGPVLVVPYTKTVREVQMRNNERHEEKKTVGGWLYFLPENFEFNGNMATELRERGIYRARLFHAKTTLSGSFTLPVNWGVEGDLADYTFAKPFVAIGIRDIRGIENSPALRFGDETMAFEPGSQVSFLGDGIHAALEIKVAAEERTLAFSVDLDLQGTGKLELVPVGKETRVSLASDWPHPSFIGSYLPAQREVGGEGFTAQWQTSFFSTNLHEALTNCTAKAQCDGFQQRTLGVSLLDGVDQYLKSDRAIKYALLFIALTFAGFFLMEVLKRLAVHPVQYGLVGLALAIFYLLLVSLSEHIGFTTAYLISASACVLLNGFYAANVLQAWTRGIAFGGTLAALYGLLFGLLSAEDYALLMGSMLVFAVLGLFMVLTRKVDWFAIGRSDPPTFDLELPAADGD